MRQCDVCVCVRRARLLSFGRVLCLITCVTSNPVGRVDGRARRIERGDAGCLYVYGDCHSRAPKFCLYHAVASERASRNVFVTFVHALYHCRLSPCTFHHVPRSAWHPLSSFPWRSYLQFGAGRLVDLFVLDLCVSFRSHFSRITVWPREIARESKCRASSATVCLPSRYAHRDRQTGLRSYYARTAAI